MTTFEYKITDETGIHARPAGQLVKEAKKFESKITIKSGEKEADATQLFKLMGMGIKKDDVIVVTAEGSDETEAVAAIEKFFKENL